MPVTSRTPDVNSYHLACGSSGPRAEALPTGRHVTRSETRLLKLVGTAAKNSCGGPELPWSRSQNTQHSAHGGVCFGLGNGGNNSRGVRRDGRQVGPT
jgi:hypothetical protein